MGRNNGDFQHSVMYHGSSQNFKVGDIVLPHASLPQHLQEELRAEPDRGRTREPLDHAYATNLPLVADLYSGKTGKVYNVEPVDRDEMKISRPIPGVGKDAETSFYYTSQKGFRVTGEHSGSK